MTHLNHYLAQVQAAIRQFTPAVCRRAVAAQIGGIEAVANGCRIGLRAAQNRVKEQLRCFEVGGDLFGGVPTP